MNRNAILEKLRLLFDEKFVGEGFELMDIICHQQGKQLSLRVLVDRLDRRINLDECARLGREIINELGQVDAGSRYILEVSSPGLDRPLKTEKDFKFSIGKRVVFFLKEPIGGKLQYEGLVHKVEGNLVFVQIGDQEVIIALEKIAKAKQVI